MSHELSKAWDECLAKGNIDAPIGGGLFKDLIEVMDEACSDADQADEAAAAQANAAIALADAKAALAAAKAAQTAAAEPAPDNTMLRHYIRILRRWMLVVIGIMVWAWITNGWTA